MLHAPFSQNARDVAIESSSCNYLCKLQDRPKYRFRYTSKTDLPLTFHMDYPRTQITLNGLQGPVY